MKLTTNLLLLAFMAILSFSCSTDSLDNKAEMAIENLVVPETKTIEVEILEQINNHRLSEGLEPLQSMSIIKSAAFSHTDYMVEAQEVSHDNFFTRSNYLKANAGAIKVSENVAYGFTSAESVVRAWMKSEAHQKNIVGDFTNFEVSAEQDVNGKWYYTNIFIKK